MDLRADSWMETVTETVNEFLSKSWNFYRKRKSKITWWDQNSISSYGLSSLINFLSKLLDSDEFWNFRFWSLMYRSGRTPLSRLFARRRREKIRNHNGFLCFSTKKYVLQKEKSAKFLPLKEDQEKRGQHLNCGFSDSCSKRLGNVFSKVIWDVHNLFLRSLRSRCSKKVSYFIRDTTTPWLHEN